MKLEILVTRLSIYLSSISGIGYLIEKLANWPIIREILDWIGLDTFLDILFVTIPILILVVISRLFSGKRFKIEDQIVAYSIKILNLSGDTLTRRKTTFKITDGIVKSRFQHVFCDISQMNNIDFKAYDDKGRSLHTKSTLDTPSRKEFEIQFPHPITVGEYFTYSYQYYWEKYFNVEEDYVDLKDSSLMVEFCLVIDSNWSLLYIHAKECYSDGSDENVQVTLKEKENNGDNFTTYRYTFKKKHRHAVVKVNWKIKVQ